MAKESNYATVRDILLTAWDPIGVGDVEAAQGEYDAYARHLHARLSSGASADEIENYLLETEAETMGLSPDWTRAQQVSAMLQNLVQTEDRNR